MSSQTSLPIYLLTNPTTSQHPESQIGKPIQKTMEAISDNSSVGTTPNLPTELWLNIFRLATLVPGIFDPLRPHDPSRGSLLNEIRDVKTSLFTKKHIVLVCKAWNMLGSQYLYESILLDRTSSLQGLLETLTHSKDKPNPFVTLGKYTRRVDVAYVMSPSHIKSGTEIDLGANCLAKIIRYLPNATKLNLSVLLTRFFSAQTSMSILRSIAETCGPRLEAITWYTNLWEPPTWTDWLTFLAETPNIRYFNCRTPPFIQAPPVEHEFSLSGGSGYQGPPRLALLQRLYVPTPVEAADADGDLIPHLFGDLPSLRHLTIEVRNAETPIYESTLLRRYGGSLETLQLILLTQPFQQIAHTVFQTCPKLTRLDLSFIHFQTMQVVSLPQTIEILGLQCKARQISDQMYHLLFEHLWQIGDKHKKLKVIQFLDEANVQEIRHRPTIIVVARKLKTDLDIDVHDHMGHLMFD